MEYEYVGILCGADDSIINLKYGDIRFEKEILSQSDLVEKYGLNPADNIYFDGAYTCKEENNFEIIKIIILKEKSAVYDERPTMDFEIEQEMHQQIDFFISSMNMITDGFLYVICPRIYMQSIIDNIKVPYSFPYELPNFTFRGCSGGCKRDKYFEKYSHDYLIEKLNVIKKSNILCTVKDYYNHYKWTHNRPIEFIILMICLEVLLSNTNDELSHRISRNVAVLFSKDKIDGNHIYGKMKKMYGIRSKIVHDGIFDCSKFQTNYKFYPLFELKNIVYDVIKLYLENDVNKDSLIEDLNATGYGDFRLKISTK